MTLFATLLWIRERSVISYGISIAACITGLLLRFAIAHTLVGAPFLTFIPAVVTAAFCGGIGPGLLAVVLSAGLADYFFIPVTGIGGFWPSALVVMLAFIVITGTMVVLVNAAMMSSIRLAGATAQLRLANETLEARIAERTAALMEAEAALRQAQKMEAVGQLTGGIAHDFNNLLTGINGCLERLQTRLSEGRVEELARYVSAARESGTRAAALTHRLLAFSRRQPLAPRATDIGQLARGMAALIERSIGPGVRLEFALGEDLWTTRIDPHQLEQGLLNLCINASDAMPNGGRLRVQAGNATLGDGPAQALALPPGDYVTLSVRDTGTGMPPEVKARAFDPFFTTKPVGEGTGLGLSMIYGFVRQSGGQVQLDSNLGEGTELCLYLPRHVGPPEAVSPPSEPAMMTQPAMMTHAGEGARVLVVDDEASVRMLVTDLLEELDYQVLQAADGPAALQRLQAGERIDLLVTDIGLPGGMNGSQLATAALALRPGLKILFITGYADADMLSPGSLPRGASLLGKPFTMAALAGRVQEMLAVDRVRG